MSASEKLKALGTAVEFEPRVTIRRPLYVSDAEGALVTALRDSLPQIVAVVETAEDAADHFIDQSAHDYGWPIELKTALAALDEALS
jgi:hypothetical protein